MGGSTALYATTLQYVVFGEAESWTDLFTFLYDPNIFKTQKLVHEDGISSEQNFSFSSEYDFVVPVVNDSYQYVLVILVIVYIVYCLLYVVFDSPFNLPCAVCLGLLESGTIINAS